MRAIRSKALGAVAWLLAVGVAAVWVVDLPGGERPASREPVPIIFDTDIGTDVDDAGALAILHVMADRGEARILATMSANSNRWCAPALDTINTYYGRPDLPIGCSRSGPDPEEWYHPSVEAFDHDLKQSGAAPEAVALYRQILAAQPDDSVTIVVVGWLTNMADLLASEPDQYSPLSGKELVEKKVKELVSMGGRWPNSPKVEGEYNFRMDGPAACKVIRDWPGRIVFTGLGKNVMTGARLLAQGTEDNPVRAYYANFFEKNKVSERSSWDLIAVLYAVRGTSDYFTVVSGGKCVGQEDGSNQWVPGPVSNHAYLDDRMPPKELAATLEDLLLTSAADTASVTEVEVVLALEGLRVPFSPGMPATFEYDLRRPPKGIETLPAQVILQREITHEGKRTFLSWAMPEKVKMPSVLKITGLAAGTYQISARTAENSKHFKNHTPMLYEDRPVEIRPGVVDRFKPNYPEIDTTVEPGDLTVQGVVYDAKGKPLKRRTICLTPAPKTEWT